jgi:hypothetical protein
MDSEQPLGIPSRCRSSSGERKHSVTSVFEPQPRHRIPFRCHVHHGVLGGADDPVNHRKDGSVLKIGVVPIRSGCSGAQIKLPCRMLIEG